MTWFIINLFSLFSIILLVEPSTLSNCIIIALTNFSIVSFDINKVQQLNPTIAGKMFFNQLNYFEVKEYYNLGEDN
mgnify:CR=1 FL=1